VYVRRLPLRSNGTSDAARLGVATGMSAVCAVQRFLFLKRTLGGYGLASLIVTNRYP